MNPEITVRLVRRADAEEMRAIYEPYVKDTAVTFEYETPSLEEFWTRMAKTLLRYPCLAAFYRGETAGYAYASPFKQRAAYDWSVETSVYVKTGLHGKGVGKALYTELEERLKKQRILNMNACIAWPNPESVGFHESMGYRTVAHFSKCGYKCGGWYDMIWMEKLIGEHPERPEPVLTLPQILSAEK